MKPRRLVWTACGLAVVAGMLAATPLRAQQREHFNDPYSIMAPEPWLAPKYRSPRGLPQKPNQTRTQPLPPSSVGVASPPPPTVLPSGQTVPNLAPVRQGIVPGGGAESFGDRAIRCAHQSGLYGVPAGQQGAYISTCVQ